MVTQPLNYSLVPEEETFGGEMTPCIVDFSQKPRTSDTKGTIMKNNYSAGPISLGTAKLGSYQ